MSNNKNHERLDTLLALALAFPEDELGQTESSRALRFLQDLGVNDSALAQRAAVYERLEPDKQEKWLKRALGHKIARGRAIHLDEQIHHTHLSRALRTEPVRIQTIILKNLPKDLVRQIANELGIVSIVQELINEPEQVSSLPSSEVASIVRRVFLSNFVTVNNLYTLKPLDMLRSVDLVNFIHQMGAREIAIACRGVAEMETVAAFLRRFTAEDARIITSYLTNLKELEPKRVLFAEQMIQEALSIGLNASAMLNHIGSNLVIIALAESDSTRLRYTLQKLPFEASVELNTMFDKISAKYEKADENERSMLNSISRETEHLASAYRKRNELS